MKKLTILSTVLLTATFLISCSKPDVKQPTSSFTSAIDPSKKEVRIVSSWISLAMNAVSTRSQVHLQGSYQFVQTVPYDKKYHVELLYTRIPGPLAFDYRRVPMRLLIETLAGDRIMTGFQFQTNDNGFVMTINNTDQSGPCPDAVNFSDFKYRYIVIPKTDYDRLSINWDNYAEVAQALNL